MSDRTGMASDISCVVQVDVAAAIGPAGFAVGISARRPMRRRSVIRRVTVGICALVIGPTAACSAPEEPVWDTARADRPEIAVGATLSLCRGCPVFVRVPDAPTALRPIRFVAAGELTWNNYLAAYDDGTCKLPEPNFGPGSTDKNDIPENLANLRIDWPIGQLGVADVQCYIGWLQKRTGYRVALPSDVEWEWFARAGHVGVKYPWGNEPDPTREAVSGNPVVRTLLSPLEYRRGGKYVGGVKTGRFPANPWGLYDLMGSERELTSTNVPKSRSPSNDVEEKASVRFDEKDSAVLKGSNAFDANWKAQGISGRRLAVISAGTYSTFVAVRLVLIGERV